MTKIKIFNPFYKLQPTVHCQNPGRTEVIQHWGAIQHRFWVDE